MRVRIGLPAAGSETDMTLIGGWAAEAREAGGADVLLFPCSGDLEQVSLLAPGPATEGTNA